MPHASVITVYGNRISAYRLGLVCLWRGALTHLLDYILHFRVKWRMIEVSSHENLLRATTGETIPLTDVITQSYQLEFVRLKQTNNHHNKQDHGIGSREKRDVL